MRWPRKMYDLLLGVTLLYETWQPHGGDLLSTMELCRRDVFERVDHC